MKPIIVIGLVLAFKHASGVKIA